MIFPEIQVNPKDLKMLESQFRDLPKQIPTILSRAINRIATMTNTQVRRGITRQINLQSNIVGRYLRLFRATRNSLAARIELAGWRIPAAKFKGRRLKRGASYQIRKGEGRKTLLYKKTDPIFWGVMPTGHEGIFTRPEGKRGKIHELLGPSISTAWSKTPGLVRTTIDNANHNLAARIRHEIKYELEKRKAKP
ncbi:MAG: hypothetical protein BWY71_00135 [Planctomycetes bacterium ADurb.Bin412]|jgi:hypothetical protein|nr:MAG: hypothetical protein BWY71_00135 [Planctomycetes bacterium ADurb.Bin412]